MSKPLFFKLETGHIINLNKILYTRDFSEDMVSVVFDINRQRETSKNISKRDLVKIQERLQLNMVVWNK